MKNIKDYDLEDLKKVGRPAFLMCFVPATFEMIGMIILAPRLLDVSLIEAAGKGVVVYLNQLCLR